MLLSNSCLFQLLTQQAYSNQEANQISFFVADGLIPRQMSSVLVGSEFLGDTTWVEFLGVGKK